MKAQYRNIDNANQEIARLRALVKEVLDYWEAETERRITLQRVARRYRQAMGRINAEDWTHEDAMEFDEAEQAIDAALAALEA